MCPPRTPKIERAQPAAPPPQPAMEPPKAPKIEERRSSDDGRGSRKGRSALRIPLVGGAPGASGVNLPG